MDRKKDEGVNEIDTCNKTKCQDDAVALLSSGLLSIYLPPLENLKAQLLELTKKQETICRLLHSENLQLCEESCDAELQDLFTKSSFYKEKLTVLKNKMTALHDRSNKLKRRVLKLEQNKQNEAQARVQQREREEQLIGKHAE